MAALAILVLALAAAPPAAAAGELTLTAIVSPLNPTEGDTVTVNFTLVNHVNSTQQSLVISVQQGTSEIQQRAAITVNALQTYNGSLTFTAPYPSVVNQDKPLSLQLQYATGTPIDRIDIAAYHVSKKPVVVSTFNAVPIVVGITVAAGALGFVLYQRRKKAEEARVAAETAAKSEVERRVAAETARELSVTQKIHGKYPAEFYQRKRQRLGVFIPIGLTSAGLTVLQRKVVEEKKIVYSCPRCGTHKDAFDAPCPRCTVQDGIEALRVEMKKHRTGADMSDVGDLLQQAEFQLSYSSFGEAGVLVNQARTTFNEILAGGERTVKVKRIETISAGDKKPTVLDLGLGTEHTLVDQAAEEHEHEAREDYAREGAHCPTCGHSMYGDLCAFCHFDDYANIVADVIAQAAKAGAETVEPRDLLERGLALRGEDNKSTGSRYLNRAHFVAKKHLHDHLASKAEGMIDYARTMMLVGEEDGITADLKAAEVTIGEADAKRAAGDAAAAVDLAAKAESQIQVALHELAKQVAIKRIDKVALEIDEARAKGVKVEAAEDKLKSARVDFDGGEFERARDAVEGVRKAVLEASQGKSVCPKCGKPVQATWARCPFCTTPLK